MCVHTTARETAQKGVRRGLDSRPHKLPYRHSSETAFPNPVRPVCVAESLDRPIESNMDRKEFRLLQLEMTSIRVRHVDVVAAIAVGNEGDAFAVSRPGRKVVLRWIAR